jgi:hypothetical protein
MRSITNVALVLAGLAIGCGAGAVATRPAGAVDPLDAYSASAPRPRWEQFCEPISGGDAAVLNARLAMRGAEGWELIALPFSWTGQGAAGAVCFKRAASGRFAPSTL